MKNSLTPTMIGCSTWSDPRVYSDLMRMTDSCIINSDQNIPQFANIKHETCSVGNRIWAHQHTFPSWSIQPPLLPFAVSCLDCLLLAGLEVCVTSGRRAKTSRKKRIMSKRETSIRRKEDLENSHVSKVRFNLMWEFRGALKGIVASIYIS